MTELPHTHTKALPTNLRVEKIGHKSPTWVSGNFSKKHRINNKGYTSRSVRVGNKASGCTVVAVIYLNRFKNFNLTLIQANTEWIDTTFNLPCILKEWEFPSIKRKFPTKADKCIWIGTLYTCANCFNWMFIGLRYLVLMPTAFLDFLIRKPNILAIKNSTVADFSQ